MADYSSIDPILDAWAQTRGLHVYTGHRQNEVRSVTVYIWLGSRHDSTGHLWIDPPDARGLIGVHAAQGGYRDNQSVPLEKLGHALETAFTRLAAEHERRAHAELGTPL